MGFSLFLKRSLWRYHREWIAEGSNKTNEEQCRQEMVLSGTAWWLERWREGGGNKRYWGMKKHRPG